MTLTVGSLFAGIGGMELGFERAGMETRWQVEFDPYCQRVLAKHWPDVPRYGDIKEVDPGELEPVDVICGGFPCQPFSSAGKQKGLADERWLWPEFARVVRGVRPRYVVVENVPGLLTLAGGRAAQAVLGELSELGFDAEWACISAAAVGAPHLRYRVIIVAHAAGKRAAAAQQSGHLCVIEPGRQTLADAQRPGPQGPGQAQPGGRAVFAAGGPRPGSHAWLAEPDVGRVAHGVPARMDRLRALGNAVVPQVAEWVGHQIMAFDAARELDVAA